jgi:hypothetical protein
MSPRKRWDPASIAANRGLPKTLKNISLARLWSSALKQAKKSSDNRPNLPIGPFASASGYSYINLPGTLSRGPSTVASEQHHGRFVNSTAGDSVTR